MAFWEKATGKVWSLMKKILRRPAEPSSSHWSGTSRVGRSFRDRGEATSSEHPPPPHRVEKVPLRRLYPPRPLFSTLPQQL